MTLEEYEIMFMQERAKRKRKMKAFIFIAGMISGQVAGIIALALGSVSRRNNASR